ncbi:MAG TPA: hypothetical protein VGU02_14475 [Gaiellaceae bacterium]|nr:hypothetical protein [Gaiellaceae bacterium]
MSRKRTKQYLMLLMVIGLVSIAAGGGGTFASFTAETANNGNYFATGTLVLNDNGGTNTCTSAINSTNSTGADANNLNSGTDCDTLFKVKQFTQPNAATTGTITHASTTSIAYSGLTAPIYKGDSVTITQGIKTDTLTVATSSTTATGVGTFTVTAAPVTNDYTAGATVVDNNPTYFANLTLTNAGSINAKDISFKAGSTPCTSQYTEAHGTLNTGSPETLGASSGSSIPTTGVAAGGFQTGDAVVVAVSGGGHAQTFIATGPSTGTTVPVTAQPWNYAYTSTAIVSGPEFNGASAQALCSSLRMAIVETGSAFDQNMSSALGCAYGSTTAPVATNSCDLGASPLLTALPTSLTNLGINTVGGNSDNTSGFLNAGKTRYFLIAVHYTGSAFDNRFQNTSAAGLNLTWHIDQA